MQTRLVRICSSMDADVPAYLALFTAYPYEAEIGLTPAGRWEKLLHRVNREGAGNRHALLFAGGDLAGYESTGRMAPTDGAETWQNGN